MKGEIVNWGVEITDNCIMVEITHNSRRPPSEQRGFGENVTITSRFLTTIECYRDLFDQNLDAK